MDENYNFDNKNELKWTTTPLDKELFNRLSFKNQCD